jgi:hypothetical protein
MSKYNRYKTKESHFLRAAYNKPRVISRNSVSTKEFMYKQEDGDWVAIYPYFDLVVVSSSKETAARDLIDIILAHVRYCIENDNWDYLIRKTPSEELVGFVKG